MSQAGSASRVPVSHPQNWRSRGVVAVFGAE